MNLAIFNALHGLSGHSDALDLAGIFLAKYLAYFFVVFYIVLIFWNADRRRRLYNLLFSGLALLLASGVIKELINYYVVSERPFSALNFTPLVSHAADAAFPSGHAVFFFTLAMTAFLIISRKIGVWLFVAAALIGIGRVYAGLHWPIDIAAGAAIGILVPYLVRFILPKQALPSEQEAA